MCVECVLTGMLFTMQNRNPGLRHGGIFEDIYFSYNKYMLIQVQFRIHKNEFVCPLSSGGYQWKRSLINQTCSVHCKQ